MDDERLEGPVAQDLSARRTATTVPIEAQDEIIGDAHADLKAPPEHGRETIRASGDRFARTAQGTEGGDAGAKPVPKGRVTWSADASALRRAKTAPATWASSHPASWPSINWIAANWIAAFGTMNVYITGLGRTEAARNVATSRDEVREADERHTGVAKQSMAAQTDAAAGTPFGPCSLGRGAAPDGRTGRRGVIAALRRHRCPAGRPLPLRRSDLRRHRATFPRASAAVRTHARRDRRGGDAVLLWPRRLHARRYVAGLSGGPRCSVGAGCRASTAPRMSPARRCSAGFSARDAPMRSPSAEHGESRGLPIAAGRSGCRTPPRTS